MFGASHPHGRSLRAWCFVQTSILCAAEPHPRSMSDRSRITCYPRPLRPERLRIQPSTGYTQRSEDVQRLLVGLGSTGEQLLGFDTSVQWKINKNTKKSGTIDVCGQQGGKQVHDLKFFQPIFKRDGVRGRGTACWIAFDSITKREVAIKDIWRLGTRRPEHGMLNLARGLAGVCLMLDCEPARG